MRVFCKACGSVGAVSSRYEQSPSFSTLYCKCVSEDCGHSWVSTLAFSHTLAPSALAADQFLLDRLRELPPAQQQDLFEGCGLGARPRQRTA